MLPSENCPGGLLIFGELAPTWENALVGLENELDDENVWLQGPPKQLWEAKNPGLEIWQRLKKQVWIGPNCPSLCCVRPPGGPGPWESASLQPRPRHTRVGWGTSLWVWERIEVTWTHNSTKFAPIFIFKIINFDSMLLLWLSVNNWYNAKMV